MSDKRDRDLVQTAINTCFSDLKGDPWLAQRIINGADKEQKVKKKLSLGLVLVIALALATLAVAIAAQHVGWTDFFGKLYNINMPKEAQEAMDQTKPLSFQVGPMTFTYNQLVTDGYIALSSAGVHTTDGSEVLYAMDTDIYDAVDAIGDKTVVDKYGLEPGTSWLDAAKELGLPLYGIRALVEVEAPYSGGESMEDALWSEDGSIVYFSMPMLDPDSAGETLPVTLYMAVTQFDPDTEETIEKWRTREETTLSTLPMLEEKTYRPEGDGQLTVMMRTEERVDAAADEAVQAAAEDAALDGAAPKASIREEAFALQLESVKAKRYATGVYLSSTFTLPADMTMEDVYGTLYNLSLCDGNGAELPGGLNLSGYCNVAGFPTVTLETSSSIDTLPESLMITDGTVKVVVK